MTTRTRQNFRGTLGTTWGFDVKCRDSLGTAITPGSATWRLADGATVLIECTIGNGIRIETVGSEVWARIDVPPNLQRLVRPGVYDHALRITTPQGAISEQIEGFVTVVKSNPFPDI